MNNQYTPPKVWTHDAKNGGDWANINRPVSGATYDKKLPVGKQSIQLYSMGTPNGQKITIMLEELLALGKNAQYDAHMIEIGKGEQFSSGFVDINPNSKIPVLVDLSNKGSSPIFESASILVYLAKNLKSYFLEVGISVHRC